MVRGERMTLSHIDRLCEVSINIERSTSPNYVLTQGSRDRGNQEEKCCLHQGNMQLTKLFYYSLDSWMTHLTCIYSFYQTLMLQLF